MAGMNELLACMAPKAALDEIGAALSKPSVSDSNHWLSGCRT